MIEFVYQKYLIQTFHTSFILQNNLCDFSDFLLTYFLCNKKSNEKAILLERVELYKYWLIHSCTLKYSVHVLCTE